MMEIDCAVSKRSILEVRLNDLPEDWRGQQHYKQLKEIGDKWYKEQKALILKVPSAIIPEEFNFIINTKHPQFEEKVMLDQSKEFNWDPRLSV